MVRPAVVRSDRGHPWLPFGTLVTVTDVATGRSVTVVIDDRGPFAPGRIIDLSPEAFSVLSPLGRGVLDVQHQLVARRRGRLGAGAIRELAARYGIRPDKALGQNFLLDPNLARAIAATPASDRAIASWRSAPVSAR